MVFRIIGQGLRKGIDTYMDNAKVHAGVNTAALYGGIRALGAIDGVSGDLADLVAPLASGGYLNTQLNKDEVCSREFFRDISKVALSGVIRWEFADKLTEYRGGADLVNMVEDTYRSTHAWLANNLTDMHEKAATGGIIGTTAGVIGRICKYT